MAWRVIVVDAIMASCCYCFVVSSVDFERYMDIFHNESVYGAVAEYTYPCRGETPASKNITQELDECAVASLKPKQQSLTATPHPSKTLTKTHHMEKPDGRARGDRNGGSPKLSRPAGSLAEYGKCQTGA